MSSTDLQVKSKIGKQAYAAVRQKILEHMESFVENIYDLHRLTRRQHHLESICDDKEAYAAELQSLMLPSGAQEKAATGGSPEKVEEVLIPSLTRVSGSSESCASHCLSISLWRLGGQHYLGHIGNVHALCQCPSRVIAGRQTGKGD